ncbi:hypothetical protein [Rhodopila sp.]|uniref:hypothetical protein n=1 Tax=Rhodopila sp. TaxID=2480087 RepID=UPI003D10E3E4
MAEMNDTGVRRYPACALAEQSLRAEQEADAESAETLLAQADRINPGETIEVLRQCGFP